MDTSSSDRRQRPAVHFQWIAIDQLQPAPYNPRRDLAAGDPALKHLAASIERFDCVEPIVWNRRTGRVVGGHQRLKVLRRRGDRQAPCMVVDLDEADERVLNLALNRIRGDWDADKLSRIVTELSAVPDLDLALTGFDPEELQDLVALADPPAVDLTPAEPDPAELVELRLAGASYWLGRPLYERLQRIAQAIGRQIGTDDAIAVLTAAADRLENPSPGRGEPAAPTKEKAP